MRAPLRMFAAVIGSVVWIVGALIFGGDEPMEIR